jgi:hypothetical protein
MGTDRPHWPALQGREQTAAPGAEPRADGCWDGDRRVPCGGERSPQRGQALAERDACEPQDRAHFRSAEASLSEQRYRAKGLRQCAQELGCKGPGLGLGKLAVELPVPIAPPPPRLAASSKCGLPADDALQPPAAAHRLPIAEAPRYRFRKRRLHEVASLVRCPRPAARHSQELGVDTGHVARTTMRTRRGQARWSAELRLFRGRDSELLEELPECGGGHVVLTVVALTGRGAPLDGISRVTTLVADAG